MSMKFLSSWLEHSGGTKFYQVIQLEPDGGRPVTITHWGKSSVAAGRRNIRPVLGGETQVHKGRVMPTKVAIKEKRGYQVTDNTSMSVDDIDQFLVQHFGASTAFEIEQQMFLDMPAGEPRPTGETTAIGKASEPDVRPDNWGVW